MPCTCQPNGTPCPEATALRAAYDAWIDTLRGGQANISAQEYAIGMARLRAYEAHVQGKGESEA